MELTYLGQSGVLVHAPHAVVAIDPCLSDSVEAAHPADHTLWRRAFPPPLQPLDLRVDAICCTHAHDDHCDPGTLQPLLRADPRPLVFGPPAVAEQLARWGLHDRARAIPVGTRQAIAGDVFVTPIPSAHYEFDLDASGQPSYVGFVVEAGGRTVYHAGDTLAYEGLAAALGRWRFDALLLPVNGRSAAREARGITGNMHPAEAAALAAALGGPPIVPLHNDLFPANSLPWSEVGAAFAGIAWRRLMPGERLTVGERAGA